MFDEHSFKINKSISVTNKLTNYLIAESIER